MDLDEARFAKCNIFMTICNLKLYPKLYILATCIVLHITTFCVVFSFIFFLIIVLFLSCTRFLMCPNKTNKTLDLESWIHAEITASVSSTLAFQKAPKYMLGFTDTLCNLLINNWKENFKKSFIRLRPLLLSTSICLMDRGSLDRGICRLPTIYTLCHIHCVVTVL